MVDAGMSPPSRPGRAASRASSGASAFSTPPPSSSAASSAPGSSSRPRTWRGNIADARGLLLGLWVLGGFLTLAGALSYAEMAAAMPRAGGQYVFLSEAFSPLFGFLYGWTLLLAINTGFVAAVAVAFAKTLGFFVPWRRARSHALVTLGGFRRSRRPRPWRSWSSPSSPS